MPTEDCPHSMPQDPARRTRRRLPGEHKFGTNAACRQCKFEPHIPIAHTPRRSSGRQTARAVSASIIVLVVPSVILESVIICRSTPSSMPPIPKIVFEIRGQADPSIGSPVLIGPPLKCIVAQYTSHAPDCPVSRCTVSMNGLFRPISLGHSITGISVARTTTLFACVLGNWCRYVDRELVGQAALFHVGQNAIIQFQNKRLSTSTLSMASVRRIAVAATPSRCSSLRAT